jgi:hypothetical protein
VPKGILLGAPHIFSGGAGFPGQRARRTPLLHRIASPTSPSCSCQQQGDYHPSGLILCVFMFVGARPGMPQGDIFDLRIFSLQCMFFTQRTMVIRSYHWDKTDAYESIEEKPERHPTKNNGPNVINHELFHVKHFLRPHINPLTRMSL